MPLLSFIQMRLIVCVALLALIGAISVAQADSRLPIGQRPAEARSLRDLRGNQRRLAEFTGKRGVVVAFLATECPLANLYLPRILELAEKHQSEGVQFVAVYANEDETLDEVAAHSYDRNVPFPVLKDFGQGLADALGVERTPEVCVLDADLNLCYRGRIDDQYAVATRRPQPREHNLADAIASLVAGEDVKQSEVPADGCLLRRAPPPKADGEPVEYYKHVAPILQASCQTCHRPGRIGPFSLLTYEDARDSAEMLREVVAQRRMPPWHADPRYGEFHNSRAMSEQDVATLVRWVDGGMVEGDSSAAPPPLEWHEGWSIGKPDAIFTMHKPSDIPADGVLPYRYFSIPTNFAEDRWVTKAECLPGNPEVVHHIIVYMISPGRADPHKRDDDMQALTVWAPGDTPLLCAPGTAVRVPKGTELVLEMHYTPNGQATTDQSSVGVIFATEPPEREIRTNLFANGHIRIPAHAQNHEETATRTFHKDSQLLALMPHMHWRGKNYRYEAVYPDGRTETLLSTPRWDFNWQTAYWFAEPIKFPAGSQIRAVAHWDNSRYNPANPDPERNVRWGNQTWDEMMVGWMVYVHDEPIETAVAGREPNPAAMAMFKLFDRDADDRITRLEIPEQYIGLMERFGVDPDAGITPVAFEAIFNEVAGDLVPRRRR